MEQPILSPSPTTNKRKGSGPNLKEGDSSILFFQETTTPLKLEDLRSQLIRQEETIIFALIERAQFKANPTVYKKDTIQAVKQKDRVKGKSFLDFFLCETEKVHSLMRR